MSTDGHPPTIACDRCGREWSLTDEFTDSDDALYQFALDHHRHTGHYPDDVTPWIASCERCPDGEQYLRERPAMRWARTHARHTDHAVAVRDPTGERRVVPPH